MIPMKAPPSLLRLAGATATAALLLAACESKNPPAAGGGKVLATMKGQTLTEQHFDLALKTLPPERQEEARKDPEARRKFFEALLHQRLLAKAAEDAGYAKNPALRQRLALIDQRILTQHYYQTHLGENVGFAEGEIEAFYKSNPARFKNDSGRALTFQEARPSIPDSLALARADLDSFFRANSKRYEQRASCDISYLRTLSRKTAEAAKREVEKGLPFAAAVKKYSQDSLSLQNEGRIGRVHPGDSKWELGYAANIDSLFFRSGTRIPPGKLSKVLKRDSASFILVKVDSCREARLPALGEAAKQVREDYLSAYRNQITEKALDRLKAKYAVQLVAAADSVDSAALRAYYEKNRDKYLANETYEVYHIEARSKSALDRRAKSPADLEAFKAAAARQSENAWTKPKAGYIGFIKKDHALPFGIGMMPDLFPALDTLAAGKLVGPLQNGETKKWQLFFLASKKPKQVKSFDRVASLVRQDFEAGRKAEVQPDKVLARFGKDGVIRERDIVFLREEIPEHLQERYPRESLVEYLLTWSLMSREAEALGLHKFPRVQAALFQNRDNFWAGVYRDSVLSKSFALDTTLLAKTFRDNRAFFTRDSADNDYRKHSRDIAAFLALEPSELQLEYQLNPEKYLKDSVVQPYEAVRYDVFQNLKPGAQAKAEKKLFDRLKSRYAVKVADTSLTTPRLKDPNQAYKTAQSLHYDRKLDHALSLYERIREDFPKEEGLRDSLAFGMAQIYLEQERFQPALAEYRRISRLNPKSPNAYKAEFMEGFIFAEHLKNDSAAVRTFEALLKKHPKSDLSDDADWMIRNIRSGGKLMPALEGDSTAVPDSAAGAAPAADSAGASLERKARPDSATAAPAAAGTAPKAPKGKAKRRP